VLLEHELLAYAADLVLFSRDLSEARIIIEKLDKLDPYLVLKRDKCGIVELGT